jgi:glycosyltransferase involved in cell wall biosynthesis
VKKILWVTNIPSPYRVDFFNIIGESCKLKVIFERNQSDERNEDWYGKNFNNFDYVFLKGFKYKADSSISLSVIKYLKREYDIIFISNPMTPTGIISTTYLKLFKIPFVIEGDGAFIPKKEKVLKSKLKRFLLSGAKNYFSTGEAHKKYYIHYGVKENKILWYPFSSVNKNYIAKRPRTDAEKYYLRQKHNLQTIPTILFVGQFIKRKGIDLLFEIVQGLKHPFQLVMVGGSMAQLSNFVNTKNIAHNIKVVEFIIPEILIEYYDLSDVFILPTREDIWGLVINEAMSRGLPIITTNSCGAGLELVENKVNGYLFEIPKHQTILPLINELIEESEIKNRMGRESLKKIHSYSINRMSEYHIEYINSL